MLATEKNRTRGVGRSDRKCQLCSSGDREDELHILFCSAYNDLRCTFGTVFDSEQYKCLKQAVDDNADNVDDCMNRFMNQKGGDFTCLLAGYLRRSIQVRKTIISTQHVQT